MKLNKFLFLKVTFLALRFFPRKMAAIILGCFIPIKFICNNKKNKNILCFSTKIFWKDIKEISKIKDFNFLVIKQEDFSIFLKLFFQNDVCFFNHFYGLQEHYAKSQQFSKMLAAFSQFMKRVEKRFSKVDIFLLPSFNQGGCTLINFYAKKTNKKVIAFYYEHDNVPVAKQATYNSYKEYSLASNNENIIVWHKSVKDMLIGLNFARREKIHVSSPPRFNRWHSFHQNRNFPKKEYITLLSFPGDHYWAPFTYTDILLMLRDLSKHYKQYKFIVKCKDDYHISQTNHILGANNGFLKVCSELDIIELLSASKIVIGFNSLAFLEALLSEASLICPYWGDSRHDPYLLQVNPLDEVAQEIIHFPKSRLEFKKNLSGFIERKPPVINIEKRISFLNNYIYFDAHDTAKEVFKRELNKCIYG